ncbi:MAG: efflux RND transporter permease subunit [Rhodospirillaceae bacterium]|nr:efflux RND transporter permease subunit [Rhodospirillaceae bacterium]
MTPLSIIASVGFIMRSGAVLAGVVMVSAPRDRHGQGASLHDATREDIILRLRSILVVVLVVALGFLPMALNAGTGTEVNRLLLRGELAGIHRCVTQAEPRESFT